MSLSYFRTVRFSKEGYEIYRNWYIDGRLYYNKVIDLKNPMREFRN